MTARGTATGVREGEEIGCFAGLVVRGDGRGQGLGFATANVRLDSNSVPPGGVYACRVRVGGAGARLDGVANIGDRPTFELTPGEQKRTDGEEPRSPSPRVEVHILDFTGDLYGEELAVELIERLREERRFPGIPELTEQIERDVDRAREILRHQA